jgi:hypothetical protein
MPMNDRSLHSAACLLAGLMLLLTVALPGRSAEAAITIDAIELTGPATSGEPPSLTVTLGHDGEPVDSAMLDVEIVDPADDLARYGSTAISTGPDGAVSPGGDPARLGRHGGSGHHGDDQRWHGSAGAPGRAGDLELGCGLW